MARGDGKLRKDNIVMFAFKSAAAPAPRYQATRGAIYTARRLTLLQRAILLRCEGSVTLADLAKAIHAPMPEMSEALRFLCAHGLVRRW
jgi:DNA-binding MarR family transcriptional regulator